MGQSDNIMYCNNITIILKKFYIFSNFFKLRIVLLKKVEVDVNEKDNESSHPKFHILLATLAFLSDLNIFSISSLLLL